MVLLLSEPLFTKSQYVWEVRPGAAFQKERKPSNESLPGLVGSLREIWGCVYMMGAVVRGLFLTFSYATPYKTNTM